MAKSLQSFLLNHQPTWFQSQLSVLCIFLHNFKVKPHLIMLVSVLSNFTSQHHFHQPDTNNNINKQAKVIKPIKQTKTSFVITLLLLRAYFSRAMLHPQQNVTMPVLPKMTAFFHTDKRPKFSGFRSASIAQSQVWLRLLTGHFQSFGLLLRQNGVVFIR